MIEINQHLTIPKSELAFSYSRSGGPGGQNVNKVNTKVTMRWSPDDSALPPAIRQRFRDRYRTRINQEGELVLTSERYREQGRNVADCLNKLRAMVLAVVTPPRPRKKTRPTGASKAKRLREKKRKSEKKRLRGKPGLED